MGPPTDLSLPATQGPPVPSLIPPTMMTMMTSEQPRLSPARLQAGASPGLLLYLLPRPTLSSQIIPQGAESPPWRDERKLHTL